jgi:hypothetical protein
MKLMLIRLKIRLSDPDGSNCFDNDVTTVVCDASKFPENQGDQMIKNLPNLFENS